MEMYSLWAGMAEDDTEHVFIGGRYERLADQKKKAQLCFSQGNYDEALALYNRALEVSPADIEALNGKGLILLKLGREKEARRVYALIQQIQQAPGTGSGQGFFRPKYSTFPADSSYTTAKYQYQGEKNPVIAACCSAAIPGLGQVYNGELWKGIIVFALTLMGIVFLLIPGLMVWMFGVFSAYTTAGKMNSGEYPSRPASYREMLIFAVAAMIIIIIALMVALFLLSVLLAGIAGTRFPNPFEGSGVPA
jgi:tetratricopeptide (TPR) repeat protein